jgi:hypothetical protein
MSWEACNLRATNQLRHIQVVKLRGDTVGVAIKGDHKIKFYFQTFVGGNNENMWGH